MQKPQWAGVAGHEPPWPGGRRRGHAEAAAAMRRPPLPGVARRGRAQAAAAAGRPPPWQPPRVGGCRGRSDAAGRRPPRVPGMEAAIVAMPGGSRCQPPRPPVMPPPCQAVAAVSRHGRRSDAAMRGPSAAVGGGRAAVVGRGGRDLCSDRLAAPAVRCRSSSCRPRWRASHAPPHAPRRMCCAPFRPPPPRRRIGLRRARVCGGRRLDLGGGGWSPGRARRPPRRFCGRRAAAGYMC